MKNPELSKKSLTIKSQNPYLPLRKDLKAVPKPSTKINY